MVGQFVRLPPSIYPVNRIAITRRGIVSATVYLSNFARALLLPPFSLIFLCVIGLAARKRLPRFGTALSCVALGALFLLCTDIGVRMIVNPLERLATPLASTVDTNAQAIVVLTAGRHRNAPEYQGRDMPDYVALGRMQYAARLHRQTGLPVLTTGGIPIDAREPEAVVMARVFRDDFRTPVQWIESRSVNTAENAFFSAQILKRAGIKRILLVTDAMHMPRSQAMFMQAGLDVVPAPTVFLSSRRSISISTFWPSAEAMRRVSYAIYEWIGIAWYRVRYDMLTPASTRSEVTLVSEK